MPLRDHFRSPIKDRYGWTKVHGMWPAMIVRQLFDLLPPGYSSAPTVHLGQVFDVSMPAVEVDQPTIIETSRLAGADGVAPTLTLETELPEQDEFEVRVYDMEQGWQLVAAIELVSPATKDRPEKRRAFVAKVAALLQKDVCVSIIDLVTVRQSNLYAELLDLIDRRDPKLGAPPPSLYAVTLRTRKPPMKRSLLDIWHYPMPLGQPLPTLPIWLNLDRCILLPLEASYEETCRLLHIR